MPSFLIKYFMVFRQLGTVMYHTRLKLFVITINLIYILCLEDSVVINYCEQNLDYVTFLTIQSTSLILLDLPMREYHVCTPPVRRITFR